MVSTVESEPPLVLLHWGVFLENEDVDTQPDQTACNGTHFGRSQAEPPLWGSDSDEHSRALLA